MREPSISHQCPGHYRGIGMMYLSDYPSMRGGNAIERGHETEVYEVMGSSRSRIRTQGIYRCHMCIYIYKELSQSLSDHLPHSTCLGAKNATVVNPSHHHVVCERCRIRFGSSPSYISRETRITRLSRQYTFDVDFNCHSVSYS